MNSNAIKYGVISGIVSIIFSMLLYFIKPEMMFGSLAYLGMLIPVFFMWKAAKEEKLANEGYLPFGDALITCFIVAAVATIIAQIFSFVLIKYIDPSLVDVMQEVALESAEKMIGMFGGDEDALEAVRDQMEEQDMTPTIGTTLLGMLGGLFTSFIIALIVAAVVKQSNPNVA